MSVRNSEDKERWLVDRETAKTVQEISLCIAGLWQLQIAKRLRKEQVLKSTVYQKAHVPIVNNPTRRHMPLGQ